MPRPRMDPARITAVLTGVSYPARTWQLLAPADYYGADFDTRDALGTLHPGMHSGLDVVLTILHESGVVSPAEISTVQLPAQR